MDLQAELLFKILGLGGIVLFITRLEWADKIYQWTRNLPQPWADIGALIALGIIFYATHDVE